MSKQGKRRLELLAPARDARTGIAAITHGADAVYIGPALFGARASAANTTDDIRMLTDYAHRFRSKVYATVNTIIYDSELKQVEKLITELYHAGVDALIVQDMGILRLDIPPIELHASTQCDTRTPEKARFLEEAGFSQIVLARELTLEQIKDIHRAVRTPLECFIHGALCVCYSGRCQASYAVCGRSANRGNCAQLCRLPYTLTDRNGKVIAKDKHLLSLRDFNATSLLGELAEAGASSFKIEGRLKNEAYVKNVTAWYRRQLDAVIASAPDKYERASCGSVDLRFDPNPYKSFNRGFTTYFLSERRPRSITSPDTPKSLGEPICADTELHAGDGLSFFSKGEYIGVRVNKVEQGRPIAAKNIRIPSGTQLYRTYDYHHEKEMLSPESAQRTIRVDIELYHNRVTATDERGCRVIVPFNGTVDKARKPMDCRPVFEKLGGTIYRLSDFKQHIPEDMFIPRSELTALRRKLIAALDCNAQTTCPRPLRREENRDYPYPMQYLESSDNVSNRVAEEFYKSHGVIETGQALEKTAAGIREKAAGTTVMQTRHCVLRELGLCRREGHRPAEPLTLRNSGGAVFRLSFDCEACEMRLIIPDKPSVLTDDYRK